MGVFDYISSLFDDKEEEAKNSEEERSTLAPSLDPTQIEARRRQGNKKKGAPNEPPERERRSKDALAATTEAAITATTPAKPAATQKQPLVVSGKPRTESRREEPKPAQATSAPRETAKPTPPPAPAPAPPQAQPAAAQSMPEMSASDADQAIDAVFGAGASQSVTHVSAIARELDEAAVRELYAGIAAQHARPVKNFVHELRRGTVPKEWIEICRPVMATLIQGAEGMGLPDAARPMKDFDEALVMAAEGPGDAFDATVRDLLLHAWDEMIQVLPEAFEVGEDEKRRESVIIHSLLKQLPDIGTVTFERLYGAGLTTLESLYLASKEDLSVTTGIPRHLCDRIVDRVQEHRREVERMQRAMGMVERVERLKLLLEELKKRHDGFERCASEEWRDKALSEQKREHRQARQVVALKIEVVLAEMGDLEVVEHMQKLPFARRIEQLGEYIKHVASQAQAPAAPEMVPAHGAAGR